MKKNCLLKNAFLLKIFYRSLKNGTIGNDGKKLEGHLSHEEYLISKKTYAGFTVLELSKWLINGFHYNVVKKHLDDELLFTDKDSNVYEIKSEDAYEERFKHRHLFAFSNLPKISLSKIFWRSK